MLGQGTLLEEGSPERMGGVLEQSGHSPSSQKVGRAFGHDE